MPAGLTHTDTLLLKAALLDGETARQAFAAWRPTFDRETINPGHQRLLPLLYRNLTRLDISDPLFPYFRGVRNYHWTRNQLRLHAIAPVLRALNAARIPVMALKGAALFASCIDDFSLRPMDDIDLMVPFEQLTRAVELFGDHGFDPVGCPGWAFEAISQSMPGYPFQDEADHGIDLHWHMLHRDQRKKADAIFWQDARLAQLAGVDVLTPSLSHQMLHAIVHAAESNPIATLRWAADALTMLRRERDEEFDWGVLVREARDRHLAAPVHDALWVLAHQFDIAVPKEVLSGLRQSSRTLERLEFAWRRIAPVNRPPGSHVFLSFCDFRRSSDHLMRGPLVWVIEPFIANKLHASGVARQAALLLFWALGRPRWMRRLLCIDTWARRVDNKVLPSIDEAIDFETGTAQHAFLDGWSLPEPTGRWSEGSEVRLAWRVFPDEGGLNCEIEASLFTPPRPPRPDVEIWANDHLMCIWRGSKTGGFPAVCSFAIPTSALLGRSELILSFAIRGAASPFELGLSPDVRKLGIHLHRVRLRRV